MNQHVIDSLREIVLAHHGYPSDYLGLHARRLRDAFAFMETCVVELAVFKRGRSDNEHGSHLLECNIHAPSERLTLYFDFDLEDRALAAFDAIVPASETEKLRLREHPIRADPGRRPRSVRSVRRPDMRAFIVHSSFAEPKRILADDDGAAIRHYLKAHFLNGGGPVEDPKVRVYDDEAPTVH